LGVKLIIYTVVLLQFALSPPKLEYYSMRCIGKESQE